MTTFTRTVYLERLTRARQALTRAGLAAAVVVSPETLAYLVGYDGYTYWTQQALVVSTFDDKLTLILRDVDLPLADDVVGELAEIRTYRFENEGAAGRVREALRELGLLGGSASIGLELQSYALPASYYELLKAESNVEEFHDCSKIFSELRVRKTSEEIALIRGAAKMTNVAVDAAIDAVREGVTERAVAAVIEATLREHGSDYSAMPTMVSSGPRTAAVHATPTDRIIEMGDPVVMWFAGVESRYHVTAYHTVHVGEPSDEFRRSYDAARSALGVLEDGIVAGESVADVARAARLQLEASGEAQYQVARWGYGIGIAYPPVWLEAFDVIEESSDRFRPGTLMCLHVCFSRPDANFGFYVGGDYLLTDDGLEPLDKRGSSLVIL